MTRGIPDYSYDVLSGVNYHINISKPVGERIENLTMPDGTPIKDTDVFAFAVNNYRQSGGSGYPHVASAPVIYDEQKAIRELMIEWAQEKKVINPADFFVENWTVSTSAAPVEPRLRPRFRPQHRSRPLSPRRSPPRLLRRQLLNRRATLLARVLRCSSRHPSPPCSCCSARCSCFAARSTKKLRARNVGRHLRVVPHVACLWQVRGA